MQKEKEGRSSVVILKGLGMDGRPRWLFAPEGWDIAALARSYDFSGSGRSMRRYALIRPIDLRRLMDRYGERPVVDVPEDYTLSRLMQQDILAVEVLLAFDQESAPVGDMPL